MKLYNYLLLLLGSADRTDAGTCAAADASISVDNANAISLGNSANGTLSNASAAANAGIVNYVCHYGNTSCS